MSEPSTQPEGAQPRDSSRERVREVFAVCAIISVFVMAGVLLWQGAAVLLYGFAGILLALLLDTCAQQLARLPLLSRKVALVLTLVVLAGVAVGLVILLGPRVTEQIGELQQKLPVAYDRFEAQLFALPGARSLLSSIGGVEALTPDTQAVLTGTVDAFSQAFGVLGNVVMVFIIGFFVALDPAAYRDGAVTLLPVRRHAVAREILSESGSGLRRWLIGRFVAMFCVALLTGAGLWIIGLPLALTLALFAGVLSFIPFLGPALGVVLPLLIGVMQGPGTAGWVLVVFGAVQFLEGNVITPLIERRALSIPPAVLIFAQVLMGTLAGLIGVLLASPVLVVLRAVHSGMREGREAAED